MEEYRNKVANSHAIQSQNIGKSTSNISKNTGKFTSKTNQIRLGGGHGGGPTPLREPLPDCMVAPMVRLMRLAAGKACRRFEPPGDQRDSWDSMET